MADFEAAPDDAATLEQRIALLVGMVGGPVKAAAIIGKTRTHIDNMRKPDAPLRMEDVLALATAAGVSLDWVASGQVVRPDLAQRSGLADAHASGFGALPGFVRLQPLRPQIVVAGGRSIERWEPSEFAVSAQWLDGFGLTAESARYAHAGDDGMAPAVGKGAFVVIDSRPAKPRSGVYLVAVEDELLVRRLNRLPNGGAELIADADARWRYPAPTELEMYRIVWAGQAF